MTEESEVIHIYRTALCIAISLMIIFQHGYSFIGMITILILGLTLIVNMM